MLKILQARLQQYVNHEIPDVQAGFRKGRETWDQIANISWIIEKSININAGKVVENRKPSYPVGGTVSLYIQHSEQLEVP